MKTTETRSYLSRLIWATNGWKRPQYGNPDTKPVWWPNELLNWAEMKKMGGKKADGLSNVNYNEIQNFQTFVSPQASALLPHIRFLQTFANVCKCCLNDEGSMPSSIYSWSIGHILEHEFFSLGRLGGKEKKWI